MPALKYQLVEVSIFSSLLQSQNKITRPSYNEIAQFPVLYIGRTIKYVLIKKKRALQKHTCDIGEGKEE